MSIPPGKLARWYKHVLSGFNSPLEKRRRHQHDVQVSNPKGIEKITVRVPIMEVDNIGENMAIDEKQIGKEMVTILSNRDTGKIAMMAKSLKSSELFEVLSRYQKKTYEVKSITRDLSNSYDWLARQAFPNATQTADKFHILKHTYDAMQQVRVRFRQELLRDKRIQYEAFKAEKAERRVHCRETGEPYKKERFVYDTQFAGNGESYLEILARSRPFLYMPRENWSESQRERAEALFEIYPDIEDAYELCMEFRTWYSKKNIKKAIELMRQKLKRWYSNVKSADIDEMLNVKSMIERHEGVILNYFKEGMTNAIAENVNSRIQRFFNQNNGTNDIEFFYFRLKKLFA